MARNRQRAKQRQAERRARRLADEGQAPPSSDAQPRTAEPAVDEAAGDEPSLAPGIDPNLAVGAPPQDEGHSEAFIREQPDHDAAEVEDEDEQVFEDVEPVEEEEEAAYAPRGRRGETAAEAKDRPRFVQFLIASWAELQRVQWPNRQALTTLTGVVLGFVLIAGGYLGLLDAIFSRIINAIL